jgi:hypothetical protein
VSTRLSDDEKVENWPAVAAGESYRAIVDAWVVRGASRSSQPERELAKRHDPHPGGAVAKVIALVRAVAEDHPAPTRREEMPGSRVPTRPPTFVGMVIATL